MTDSCTALAQIDHEYPAGSIDVVANRTVPVAGGTTTASYANLTATDVAFNALNKKLKGFFVSAFQSVLFNQLMADRLNTVDMLQNGDIAYIHSKGAAFLVEDAAVEQPRANSFEISPSGPLFGTKTLLAEDEPGQRERAAMAEHNLSLDSFKIPGLKIYGARRPYRIQAKQPNIWWDDGLMVSFELEPGAYATTVLAEIMKTNAEM